MAEPQNVIQIDGSITFIYSDDMEASRTFYEDVIGLKVRCIKAGVLFFALPTEGTRSGSSLGVVPSGQSAVPDAPRSRREAGKDTVMLCLLTHNVDGVFERVVAAAAGKPGAEDVVVRAPSTMDKYEIRSGVVRDPSGYLVEIQRFESEQVHRQFVRDDDPPPGTLARVVRFAIVAAGGFLVRRNTGPLLLCSRIL